MKERKGIIITITAAVLWGFSGTCGQYIFDRFGADASYLTAARLLSSGLVLTGLGLFTDRKNMTAVWRSRSTALRLLIFSVAGIMMCQLTYMKTISYSNSGTATILQYVGPVLVMIVSCFTARKLPCKKETAAIILALCGTFLIATHGDIHTMVITPRALFWGIGSRFFPDALYAASCKPDRKIRQHHCHRFRYAHRRYRSVPSRQNLGGAHNLRFQVCCCFCSHRNFRHSSALQYVYDRRHMLRRSKSQHDCQH